MERVERDPGTPTVILAVSHHTRDSVLESQGMSVPSSVPFEAMFCLVCGLLRPSPRYLVLFCLPDDQKP